jgi:ketosteroid isomerase-like protein
MNKILLALFTFALIVSCNQTADKNKAKDEILKTEKAFEKMTSEKGIAEAFYYFADENAAIHRNDSLIKGKENIRIFYSKKNLINASVNWTPDFIEVSDCGTLGYTYGKYVWKVKSNDGTTTESKGIFHTVWKKQKDNTWKYVWD